MKDSQFRGIIKKLLSINQKFLVTPLIGKEFEVSKVPDNSTSGLFLRFNPLFSESLGS